MFNKIKRALLNLFTILFIATILGCPSPNTDEPEDNSYKLVEFKAEQSATATNVVIVTWKDTLCYDKYQIYYNTTNDSSTATKAYLNGYAYKESKTNYYKGEYEVSLSESGTYYFWVKAVDGSNKESEFSTVSEATAFTFESLNAPIDITVTKSEEAPKKVIITWRDSKEAYKYSIYYNTSNDSSTATKVNLNGYAYKESNTDYYKGTMDVTLSASGTYYFWVKAVDGTEHESEFSQVKTFVLE